MLLRWLQKSQSSKDHLVFLVDASAPMHIAANISDPEVMKLADPLHQHLQGDLAVLGQNDAEEAGAGHVSGPTCTV